MKLDELLTSLESPIIIRPTRRMTQGELESYLDKAADILRGNADHSEFRGYKPTRSRTVGARIDQPGRIVVAGNVDDIDACHTALRRWLARHANAALYPWLKNLAVPAGLRYADVAIKNQRTRWGSCSTTGRISLNCKLLFLPRDLMRYVIWHELCHLLEPNHSERFWMHLRHFEPTADYLHGQMRDAWKAVPSWAQRGTGLML